MRRSFGAVLALVPVLVPVLVGVPAAQAEPGFAELAALPGGTRGSAVAIND
ncbi:MAG: hypothetical protein HOV94_05980, partial [Saccharothrix sp.]|nr:hypothetical protein [Saccharothrix sp.]